MSLALGTIAPAFNLLGVDEQQHALSDYASKSVLVVIFSCNHCPYVQAWEDRLVAIQADYGERGVQLVAISSNDARRYPDDSFPAMQERAHAKQFNFPYLYDESQEVARAYGAQRTPEVFVFDSERTLRYHGTIDDNYEDPAAVTLTYLRNALDAVLAGTSPEPAQTVPVGCTIKWKA